MTTKLQRKCCHTLPPATGQYQVAGSASSAASCNTDVYWKIDGTPAKVPLMPYWRWAGLTNASWITPWCDATQYDNDTVTRMFRLDWYNDGSMRPNEWICVYYLVDSFLQSITLNGTPIGGGYPDTNQTCSAPWYDASIRLSWSEASAFKEVRNFQIFGSQLIKGINTLEFEVKNSGLCGCPGQTGLDVEFVCGTCLCACGPNPCRPCIGLVGTGMRREGRTTGIWTVDPTTGCEYTILDSGHVCTVGDPCEQESHWLTSTSGIIPHIHDYPGPWYGSTVLPAPTFITDSARWLSPRCKALFNSPDDMVNVYRLDFWLDACVDPSEIGLDILFAVDSELTSVFLNGQDTGVSWITIPCIDEGPLDTGFGSDAVCMNGLCSFQLTENLRTGRNRLRFEIKNPKGLCSVGGPTGFLCLPTCFSKSPDYHVTPTVVYA